MYTVPIKLWVDKLLSKCARTVLPANTSYVVDSILATYEHPGSGGGTSAGWAGSPCYKCAVHAPS